MLWPENVKVVEVFLALGSQWRMLAGAHGAMYLGLDYAVVQPVLELLQLKRKHWPQLFAELRMMERAALAVLNQAR